MTCTERRTSDGYTDTYSYDCDDSTGLATVWIIVIVVLIIKVAFWITVCYCCRRRRRRIYLVGQSHVQVTSCSAQTSAAPAHPQGATASAIPVAQPVLGSQVAKGANGLGMRTVQPPSYGEHVKDHAQGHAPPPSAPAYDAAYIAEPVASAPEGEPEEETVVSERVGLLAEY